MNYQKEFNKHVTTEIELNVNYRLRRSYRGWREAAAQQSGALTALAADLSSVASTHPSAYTAYDSRSWEFNTLYWLP